LGHGPCTSLAGYLDQAPSPGLVLVVKAAVASPEVVVAAPRIMGWPGVMGRVLVAVVAAA